jgi:hypothetical protein
VPHHAMEPNINKKTLNGPPNGNMLQLSAFYWLFAFGELRPNPLKLC